MKNYKHPISFVCFALLFISSCFLTGIKPLKEGGFRPKKPKFKFTDVVRDFSSTIIDTQAIYISKRQNFNQEFIKGDSLYTFYRFFSSGQAYNSQLVKNHFPTIKDMNNLHTGLIGYYKLFNDEIVAEFFVPINFGQYRIMYGKVFKDSIVFLKYQFRGRPLTRYNYDEPITLIKAKEPWMIFYAKPDW